MVEIRRALEKVNVGSGVMASKRWRGAKSGRQRLGEKTKGCKGDSLMRANDSGVLTTKPEEV